MERRYRCDSHDRLLSPRRRPMMASRDVSPSRHRRLPQYRRRTEEMNHLDRDSNLRDSRFSEYDNRDRYSGKECGSPQRREENDHLNRDSNLNALRFSDRNRDKHAADFDRLVSRDGAECKYRQGHSFDQSKRSYEDSYHGDLSSTELQYDPFSERRMKNCDSHGIGDTSITRGGDNDHYSQNHYLVSDRSRLLSVPQYLDDAKPAPLEYENTGNMCSNSYMSISAGADEKSFRTSGGDGGSRMASQYLNINTEKQRYSDFCHELHLERRSGLHDREDSCVEKRSNVFFRDRFLGTRKAVEAETYKLNEEDNLLSSRGFLESHSDYMVSSSRSLSILKEEFPGYSLHMSSDLIEPGRDLSSLPVDFRYDERKQNVCPEELGNKLDCTRGSSGLFVSLPEERQVDRLYGESGRIVADGMRSLKDVEGDYVDQHILRTDLLNHTIDEDFNKNHTRDYGAWVHDPSFKVQSRNNKFDALHLRDQSMDMLGTRNSREGYVRYGGVKLEERHSDVDGGQLSNFERSDLKHLRGYDPSFDEFSDSPEKRSPSSMVGHSLPHRSVGPHKSDSRDIKKRLGPIPQKLHVSQRLVDKRKPSVMKRLKPARPKKHAPPPWVKRREF